MNQDKISNSPDCFRNKACSRQYMRKFTAIVLDGLICDTANFINAHAEHLICIKFQI